MEELVMDRDSGAKDKEFYMNEVRAAEEKRIKETRERENRLLNQSGQAKNLRHNPTNENVRKTEAIQDLRSQQVQTASNDQPINVKPYLDQSFKMENKGLFEQMLNQIKEGAKHQLERQQQKSQLKTQQAQRVQQAQQEQ